MECLHYKFLICFPGLGHPLDIVAEMASWVRASSIKKVWLWCRVKIPLTFSFTFPVWSSLLTLIPTRRGLQSKADVERSLYESGIKHTHVNHIHHIVTVWACKLWQMPWSSLWFEHLLCICCTSNFSPS